MINHKFDLEKAFQEILYSIKICVNERFDWIIKKSHSQYINISHFRPSSWSSYIKLPAELKHPQRD